MNSILVIHPYKNDGVWVFDDPQAGLVQEPFVAGADVILDRIAEIVGNPRQGLTILFSANRFLELNLSSNGGEKRAAATGTTALPLDWKAGFAPHCSSILSRPAADLRPSQAKSGVVFAG